VLMSFINLGNGTNGSANGTVAAASTKSQGGAWEAVLYIGGGMLLVTLFCAAGIWLLVKWGDAPNMGSVSHTARVEL
jgi:flagellar biogenesis protein FliO